MTVAAFSAIGAKPTPMALSEVFTSLQSGTIEAQENPLAMIQNQSFYEVQKYLVKTAHLRAWVYIAMGKAQFDALPADLQQVVLDAGKHAQDFEHELFLKNETEFENKLKEEGMTFIDVDQKEFADAMIAGVLPILTDSQKALYEEIEAANPNK
jgi:TRAP-type C4-dicarboxylate transport system substrate-binding protein